jgi:hypothetical protein
MTASSAEAGGAIVSEHTNIDEHSAPIAILFHIAPIGLINGKILPIG